MSDFLAALGLVFVIEGLIFAAFPECGQAGHDQRAGNAGHLAPFNRYWLRDYRVDFGLAGPGLIGKPGLAWY